ncbi:hypothetical protein K7H94_22605 (plasmid) [Pantoea dispersa]|uniref:hypothetical protein n=1 Tax=Pantoea dispersa TaxID=59814 RepID=UPI001CA6DD5A|nr:hypothetical protein [Pantoea dispersa]QZY92932.1 hypothetical protein K7H94_22605 [Pantoea dispersa]
MNNYFRIVPEPLTKKDIAESLQLATRFSGKNKLAEVTLFTRYPLEIIKFLDGVIPDRDTKKLVAGEAVQYQGVNISYSTAVDETKNYNVILAIDCLPDRGGAATSNYEYQIVLASVSPDDYSLPIDHWLRDTNPTRF